MRFKPQFRKKKSAQIGNQKADAKSNDSQSPRGNESQNELADESKYKFACNCYLKQNMRVVLHSIYGTLCLITCRLTYLVASR